jgi:heptaprenyl diphosphate synthase
MSTFGIPNVAPALETQLISQMAQVESLLRSHTRSEYPFVDETAHHLVAAGGKRLRPLLTLLTAQYGDSNAEGVIAAAVACEITHLATLYHDDVMDEAPLRRGVESANMRWGNTIAILTGDFLFAKSSDLLADLGPAAVRLQARTFERLVIGQIMETQGPNPDQDPLEHYLKVVADKTGSLIAASARYGGMISGAPAAITDTVTVFGEKIGVAFQLADDVIDIASESNQSGKTPGTDLREGVPTLVTLNVMRSTNSADAELKRLLSAPIEDETTVQEVLVALRNHKALDESRQQLVQVAKEARGALGPLPINDATGALMSLCDAVIDRSA